MPLNSRACSFNPNVLLQWFPEHHLGASITGELVENADSWALSQLLNQKWEAGVQQSVF